MLEKLFLNANQITDEGCAALASALCSGALPSLRVLWRSNNPASEEAQQAVGEATAGLTINKSLTEFGEYLPAICA